MKHLLEYEVTDGGGMKFSGSHTIDTTNYYKACDLAMETVRALESVSVQSASLHAVAETRDITDILNEALAADPTEVVVTETTVDGPVHVDIDAGADEIIADVAASTIDPLPDLPPLEDEPEKPKPPVKRKRKRRKK